MEQLKKKPTNSESLTKSEEGLDLFRRLLDKQSEGAEIYIRILDVLSNTENKKEPGSHVKLNDYCANRA